MRRESAVRRDLRVLHRLTPSLHDWSPPLLGVLRLGDDIRGIEAGELGLVRWLLAHLPKKSAFRIGGVCSDVQRAFGGVQPSDDFQARLVHRTLGLLGILESDTNLSGTG